MKNLNLAVLLIFSYSPILAEPITVRTGEHGDYTRIAIDSDPGVQANVEQNGRDVKVTIPSNEDGFDIDTVFDRITQDRIVRIQQDTRVLTVSLACDCGTNIFTRNDGIIVIDISEQYETLETDTANVPTRIELAKEKLEFIELNVSDTEETSRDRPNANVRENPLRTMAMPLAIEPQADPDVLLETQSNLLTDLAGAASRGILRVDGPILPRREDPQIDTEIFDSSSQITEAPESVNDTNIRITSSRDTDLQSDSRQIEQASCPDPDIAALSKWGGTGDFHFEVTSRRLQLTNERDELDLDTAKSLARSYLYFGFSTETRQLLEALEKNSIEKEILIEISKVLEDRNSSKLPNILKYSHCNAPISLWAFLANPTPAVINEDLASTILLELGSFPIHIRALLAERISEKFRNAGDEKSAKVALRTIARVDDAAELRADPLTVIQDELNSTMEDIAKHEAELRRVSDVQLHLIESHTIQFRNEAPRVEVLEAAIIGSALAGRVEDALQIYDDHVSIFSEDEKAETINRLLRIALGTLSFDDTLRIISHSDFSLDELNEENFSNLGDIVTELRLDAVFPMRHDREEGELVRHSEFENNGNDTHQDINDGAKLENLNKAKRIGKLTEMSISKINEAISRSQAARREIADTILKAAPQ